MSSSRGNVLFLILIAVVLFAALSYAITKSSRNGEKGADKEKADLQATRILAYAVQLNAGFQRVRVTNGCNLKAIDNNVIWGSPSTYPGKCNVFDMNSGGRAISQIVKDGDQTIFADTVTPPGPGKVARMFNTMNVYDVGTPVSEDIFFVFNIKKDICAAINRKLNIPMVSNDLPLEETPYEGGSTNPHGGSTGNNVNLTIGTAASPLRGKPMGCYRAARGGSDMGYHFYYVLAEF